MTQHYYLESDEEFFKINAFYQTLDIISTQSKERSTGLKKFTTISELFRPFFCWIRLTMRFSLLVKYFALNIKMMFQTQFQANYSLSRSAFEMI